MRILMVAQFYAPVIGGEERVVQALSTELAGRGHEVAVATLAVEGAPPYEESDGVRIHRLPSTAGRLATTFTDPLRRHAMPTPDPETTLALRRVLRRERPEIVHAHNWLVHSFVPLKPRSGARLVMSLHDFSRVCATKRWMYRGAPCAGPGPVKCVRCAAGHYGAAKGAMVAVTLNAMRPWVAAAVDVFAPVSRAVAEGARLDGLRHEVVPNFIPDELLGEPAAPAAPSLPPDGFLLFAGDATRDKGADLLLDAYARLDAPPPLVFIGRSLSDRLATPPPGVVVLGPRPHADVVAAMRRCAVVVVPSLLPEAFGIAALEAQALGRPVIAAAHGGLPDVVTHELSGLLIAPGDGAGLYRALERLIADGALRAALGACARDRARAFAASAVLPRVERLYERARLGCPPAESRVSRAARI